ncbi:MAG: hypothetical protein Q8Q09_18545 [Deltaproteobacteria bacterium]|nr:hypothetical protein [Deltaproteobacteria bacterium]
MSALQDDNLIKGQSFRTFLAAYTKLKGVGTSDALLPHVPPQLAEAIRYGTLLASTWHPIAWYRALHQAVENVHGVNHDFARQIGREATMQDMRGVYSFILRIVSPARVITNMDWILGLYIKQFHVTQLVREPTHVECRLVLPGSSELMWHELHAGSDVMLNATGAKELKSVLVLENSNTARWQASWRT